MVSWCYGVRTQKEKDKAMKTISRFRSMIIAGIAIVAIATGIGVGTAGMETANELQQVMVQDVVDGDTLIVVIDGKKEYVRLIGVDTPESVHPDKSRNTEAGESASEFTKTLVKEGSMVYLQKDTSDRDKYDRLLRYVWLERPSDVNNEDEIKWKMLNAILLHSGYAQAKAYEPDTTYADLFSSFEQINQVSFTVSPLAQTQERILLCA